MIKKTYELKEIHTIFQLDEVNSTEDDIVWIEDIVTTVSIHESLEEAITEMKLLIDHDSKNIHAAEYNWLEEGISVTVHAFDKEHPDRNDYQSIYIIREYTVN